MAIHRCNKETEIELLKQDNEYIKHKIDEIHRAIVGNGKPGLQSDVRQLNMVQQQHVDMLKKHSQIIDGLNTKLAYYAGAIAVIVFVITWLPRYFM